MHGAPMDARKSSFPPVVDAGVQLLVLGSLPGEKSLVAGRYYAHPQNQFWRLMGAVLGEQLADLEYTERLALLLRHGVGLWDVVASATRRGSSDSAIRDPIANDLPGLLATLPRLRAIAFNGGTALRHGRAQLGDDAARYAIVGLPSSSPLHTVGLAAKQAQWDQLGAFVRR